VQASGFVYLVGAGPGDPRLLTLRAYELLRSADVLAHDELVTDAILALAPHGAERLAVGRRRGHGKLTYRLHPAVLERARAGRSVVRLKCGDPFIFGRGGEEAEELAEAGIPFEIVPGVSAAIGAAAYAGIPLTHRRHAGKVTLATGHDADDAQGPRGETVVLFMAARRLAQNIARLVAGGMARSTPAAYITRATTPAQRVVIGTLEDLSERTRDADLDAPALVIVGDVVVLRERIAWFERQGLDAS
jgi:uroporphyrinogen III methyltransferase/synthase